MYEPSAKKYRPTTLDTYIGQPHIVPIIRGMASKNKWAQTYLIHGAWGCGKTTLARIIARYMNCSRPLDNGDPCGECKACKDGGKKNVIEINGSDKRKIDDIRNLIKQSRMMSNFKHRVIIIDEAHQLVSQAQEALLKPLEDNIGKTVWILCTTDPKKLKQTIVSRSCNLPIRTVEPKALTEFMQKISTNENITIKEEILSNIAIKTEGHVRDCLQILDQIIRSLEANNEVDPDQLISQIIESSLTMYPSMSAKNILKVLYEGAGKYSAIFLQIKHISNPKLVWEELINFNEETIDLNASPRLTDPYKKDWHKVISSIKSKHNAVYGDNFDRKQFLELAIGIQKILLDAYKNFDGWDTDRIYVKVPIIEAIEFTNTYLNNLKQ